MRRSPAPRLPPSRSLLRRMLRHWYWRFEGIGAGLVAHGIVVPSWRPGGAHFVSAAWCWLPRRRVRRGRWSEAGGRLVWPLSPLCWSLSRSAAVRHGRRCCWWSTRCAGGRSPLAGDRHGEAALIEAVSFANALLTLSIAVGVLRRGASRADGVESRRREAEHRVVTAHASDVQRREVDGWIHDEVMHVLRAVDLAGRGLEVDQVRHVIETLDWERADSVAVSGAVDLRQLLGTEWQGVEVTIHGEGVRVPAAVGAAITAAARGAPERRAAFGSRRRDRASFALAWCGDSGGGRSRLRHRRPHAGSGDHRVDRWAHERGWRHGGHRAPPRRWDHRARLTWPRPAPGDAGAEYRQTPCAATLGTVVPRT